MDQFHCYFSNGLGVKYQTYQKWSEDVTIERSTVDHSVIMAGARITDIPRLEDSLLGRRVVVRPVAAHHGSRARYVLFLAQRPARKR